MCLCTCRWNRNGNGQFADIHWASKETYHFFRAMLTKIYAIKINYIWTQISFNKTQDLLTSKMRKMWLNHERSFFENRRNCSPSELHGGGLFRTFNSYSFNFNGVLHKHRTGFELPAREASNFCDFWKFTSCDFIAFISPLIEVNFFFFGVLIKNKFT